MKLRPIAFALSALISTGPAFAHGQVSENSAAAAEQSPMGGAKSDTVKQVQEKLSQQGQNPGKADGILGPKTQAALKAFQKKNGLQPSGEADQQTLAALQIDQSGSESSSVGSSSSPSQDSSSNGASNSASGGSDSSK